MSEYPQQPPQYPEAKPVTAKPARAAPTLPGGDIPAWVTVVEGDGAKFEDKGERSPRPASPRPSRTGRW
ncbi:hypothetical protein [Streptomyces xanthophaeus]